MMYTGRLEDGTVGTITLEGQNVETLIGDFIGEVVNVQLHDENGNSIEVEGQLVEILDESEF